MCLVTHIQSAISQSFMLPCTHGDVGNSPLHMHGLSLFPPEQWDLCITNTLGTENMQFVIRRFPLFRGYFIQCHITISGPRKAVCHREVFASLRGVCYIRGTKLIHVHYGHDNILHPMTVEQYTCSMVYIYIYIYSSWSR